MFKWFRRNKGETGAPASAPESVSEQTLADAKAAESHREVEAEPRQDIEAQPRQDIEAQPRQEVEAQPHPESETQPLPERGAQAPAAYGLPLSAPEPETPAVVVQPQLLASAAPATVVPPAAVLVSAPEPIAPPVVVAPELETQPQSLPAAENSDARPRSLRERLAASTRALTQGIGKLFKRNPKLDEALLEELETALIQADMGVNTAMALVEQLRTRMRKREFADADGMFQALRRALQALIEPHAKPLQIPAGIRPFVILTVGVNGAGKTTTIGKLAQRYKRAGHSVMLAAGDTFRAAAVEQLKTWGERNQVAVVAQGSGADSASVIFDAFQAAKARSVDVLIADTAGRLHTQGHLMQELAKVKRVLGKIDPTAPHETLLVIDGGTGQNALNQAQQFHQAVGLTGVVITKLDGTAKGGMVFALCRELALPIRFIGVGEQREDLREFIASEFVNALLPEHLG